MKLALVDNLDSNMCEDRPNLGLAMLVAICEKEGITVKLINGQTQYLRQMFMDIREEVWDLLTALKEEDLSNKQTEKDTARSLLALGKAGFEQKLETLYRLLLVEKSPRAYLDANLFNEFDDARACFLALYVNAINKGREDFALITFYTQKILAAKPDVIGFSLYSKFDPLSRLIRKKLKQASPATPIVIGGPFTPFIEKEAIPKSFSREHYDYLVRGAGDEALPAFVKTVCAGKKPEQCDIPNLCYRTEEGAFISEMKLVKDVNELPFPNFSQFELDHYLVPVRVLPLLAARGCSYRKCTFCAHHLIYGNQYNVLKPAKVAETLAHLQQEYRCNFFMFNDDELPPARIRTISNAIKEKNVQGLRLCGMARLIKGFQDDTLLDLMKEAGFSGMEWGLESGSQKVLDLMQKGTNVAVAQDVLRKFHEKGMYNACFAFFGFPGETKEDAQMTIDFLKLNGEYIASLMAGCFYPEKDSPIWNARNEIGLTILADGSYTVNVGVDLAQARSILEKFSNEVMLGNFPVPSSAFRQFDIKKMRRSQPLAMVGHQLITGLKPIRQLSEQTLAEIFPIVVGKIQNTGNLRTFYPVNLYETSLVNRFAPLEAVLVDEMEQGIIVYCDGSHSMAEIIASFDRGEAEDLSHEARRRAFDFIEKMQAKNAVMFFGQKWEIVGEQ